jgi:uncharacterized membrane protein YuzA (DUF378 family)
MTKKLSWIAWLGSFLIALALFNWGVLWWFNFNIVTWMSFEQRWLEGSIYTIVTIIGGWSLGEILYKTLKKVI